MRKLAALVAVLAAFLVMVAPAGAATVFKDHFHGKIAEAGWEQDTATSSTFVTVDASSNETFLEVFQAHFDAQGNFTGAVDTTADVTSGFNLSIAKAYGSAHLSGSGLAAQQCTFDSNDDLIGCTATTMDVNVSWTATDALQHGVSNDHFSGDGFSFSDHFNGAFRDADASGTVGGVSVGPSSQEFGDLGRTNSSSIFRCLGKSC
jgi:hypothetical protein